MILSFTYPIFLTLLTWNLEHPRRYGTYPRVLGKFVREEQIISLEDAVRKMTGMTAEKHSIPDRGIIKEGYFADLVVFDPNKVIDRATFSNPTLKPGGIEFVLVNGAIAVMDGELTNRRAGTIIRRKNF